MAVDKITWSKQYELGHAMIDNQHKKIAEIAGNLYDALSGDREKYRANMEAILKEFFDYTDYHFSTEESLIEKHGYPGLTAHKLAHQNFVMELNNQKSKLYANSGKGVSDTHKCADSCSKCSYDQDCPLITAGFRFYEFVLSWLFTHIAKADKLWSVFMDKKGVRL